MALITLGVVALDCPDPQALAEFYAAVLDGTVEGEDDWYEVTLPAGRRLAFQRVADYTPPRWPGQEQPQQAHLDFDVVRADLPEAERRVLALGAERIPPDTEDQNWRVYLDPVGHPFCLCLR